METIWIWITVALAALFLWQNVIFPQFYMKRISKDRIEGDGYYLIDVRDFITFHRNPVQRANNIPLSYLSREVSKSGFGDQKIVIIADGRRAARMAAKIIQKQSKRPVYYLTV
jgi:hypothetical protein